MGIYLKISALIIPLFMLQHIIRIIYLFGYHLHFYQHYPGPCSHIDGLEHGSADLFTLPNGLTLVTSGLRSNIFSKELLAYLEERKERGRVYLIDLKNATPVPTLLTIESESEEFSEDFFNPHGISVWTNEETGEHIVYVVNHPLDSSDRIEKFLFVADKHTLHHLHTYTSPKLRTLFGVQAAGEDAFYATNFLYERRSRATMTLELFGLMPWSGVVTYDPQKGYREIISGLTSATGLVLSSCGQYLYVLLCLGAEVRVYRRKEDNSLHLQQSYQLFTQPGSATLDPLTGDLFVGCHPIVSEMTNYLNKPWKSKASSQVLHLRLAEGNITSVTELFYDDGTLVSASSAAVVYNRTLLIGSLLDGAVVCSVNVPI